MDKETKLINHIGPPGNCRTDYFKLSREECINIAKESLKKAFSCSVWTIDMNDEEIGVVDKQLTDNNIVHVFDEVMDCFNCFKTEEDMKSFYKKMRDEVTEEHINFIREHNYNTPLLKWFE